MRLRDDRKNEEERKRKGEKRERKKGKRRKIENELFVFLEIMICKLYKLLLLDG
jgi:hypothetical protein